MSRPPVFLQHMSLIFLMLSASVASAQDPTPTALPFQSWKEQQILDAQNQLLRVSARINQLKSSKSNNIPTKESSAALNSPRIKMSEIDVLVLAERDLKRSQESLRDANELKIDDYVQVYLPTLRETPDAISSLSNKMTREELAEVIRVLVRNDLASDARRQGPSLADGSLPLRSPKSR